ncbi:MAG: DnaB-like helicase C-terminal domain-containing protein [Gemmatimonadaceae bacterium]
MSRAADLSPLSQLMRRVDAVSDGAPPPDTVSTGFPSLDRLLGGGVRLGDLVVLGGDTASGKSALALAVALRVAQERNGAGAAFFSGEMSAERVMERVLAIEGRARVDDLRRGTLDEGTRAGVGAAALRMRDVLPIVDVIPDGGLEAIEAELDGSAVRLAVIDPLQGLLPGTRHPEEEAAAAIVRLKALARRLRVAVLATAALPGLRPDRGDARPRLDDFGALGAVKQHADVVLGLFREEMYQTQGAEGATEVLALKNRNGATGYVDLYFYKQWMRFEDMLDPDR